MRIHKLLATALVALMILPACQQEEDYVLPSIELGTQSLDFSDDTSLRINVTATRDWQVRSKPDWVAVDPDHGTRSSTPQRVLISVLPNSDYNRDGEILFTIGLAKAAVSVKQPGAKGEKPKGSGTKEDPYTVGGAVEFVSGMAADTPTTENVYIKGKISQITEAYSAQYGNATFYISDDEGTSFYVFRAMYLGNKKWTANDTQIQVGDEVIICGQVVNFKGNTPETVTNKSFLYSLNGKVVEPSGGGGGGGTGTPSGTGTLADPYNAAGANAYIATLAADAESDKDIYVKGKICEIANNGTYAGSGSFGNASFYISDDGTTSGAKFYVFRAMYLGNVKYTSGTDIKVGDDVIICGRVVNYKGNTPETSANKSYLYSLNGSTGGSGTGDTPGTTPGTTPGGDSSTTYSKVSSITSGGKYLLVGLKEGKYYAATPIASDKTYGRLNGKEVTVTNDKITGDMASYEFTITASGDGYTIAMPDGRFLAVDTEHDGTFQIGDSFDKVFTYTYSDGLFKIVHKSTNKTIYHGGGTYTNFSCGTAIAEGGTLLMLFSKSN